MAPVPRNISRVKYSSSPRLPPCLRVRWTGKKKIKDWKIKREGGKGGRERIKGIAAGWTKKIQGRHIALRKETRKYLAYEPQTRLTCSTFPNLIRHVRPCKIKRSDTVLVQLGRKTLGRASRATRFFFFLSFSLLPFFIFLLSFPPRPRNWARLAVYIALNIGPTRWR